MVALSCLFCYRYIHHLVAVYIFLNEWKDNTYLKKYLWVGSILQYLKAYVIEKRVLTLMRPDFDRLNHLSFPVFCTDTAVTAQHCSAPTFRLAGIGLQPEQYTSHHTRWLTPSMPGQEYLLLTIALLWKTLSINTFSFLF